VDALLARELDVVVADQVIAPNTNPELWKRRLDRYHEICKKHGTQPKLEIIDLSVERERLRCILTKNDVDTVFMLSAVFGGRGFVDQQQALCSIGFAIDQNTIRACHESGTVERITYASSACFLPHTRVLLNPDGALPICELQQGESCIDHEGRANQIRCITVRHYSGQISKVKVAGIPGTIDVTPEHPFLCPRGPTGGLKWVPVGHLRIGDYVYIPKFRPRTTRRYSINLYPYSHAQTQRYIKFRRMMKESPGIRPKQLRQKAHIDKMTSYRWRHGTRPALLKTAPRIEKLSIPIDRELAWLMGIYVAEGWIERSSSVAFAFGEEPDLIQTLSRIVLSKFGYRLGLHQMPRQRGYKLYLNIQLLAKWLGDKVGVDSPHKRIPREIMNSQIEIVEAFLRGYLQGDGNLHVRKDRSPRISCATVSEQLAWQLSMLFSRLGILPGLYRATPKLSLVDGRLIVGETRTELYFDGPQAYELARRIYGIKLMQRILVSAQQSASLASRTIRHKRTSGFKRRILRIEKAFYDGPVYNLETSRPSHSYTAYGVAVHNCVYPPSLNRPGYLLKESDALSTGEGFASSDNLYGFQKLMTEMTLQAFSKEHGLKTSSCRCLTVYGPGEFYSTHAISELCHRALKHEDPFLVWGSGCLPPHELIFAGGHLAEIASIKEGDVVADHTGNFQRVTRTYSRQYDGDICVIKGMGLRPLKLTPDHRVRVKRLSTHCKVGRARYCKPNCFCMNCDIYHRHRHGPSDPQFETVWKPAGDLSPTSTSGEYLIFPKLKIQNKPAIIRLAQYITPGSRFRRELYNDIVIDNGFAFLLGWYTAEGWTQWVECNRGTALKGQVAMSFGPTEKPTAIRIARIACSKGFRPYTRVRTPRRSNRRCRTVFQVGFAATALAKWLDQNVGNGARKKSIPSIIFHASRDVIESYLEGLFQGDGNSTPYGRRLTSSSLRLLYDTQFLLSALNKFGCVAPPKEPYRWGLLEYSSEVFNKFWQDSENIYVPIMLCGREPYSGYVYDIQTGDHTFLAPIIVHNSQERGFTYVTDIVEGQILAAEKIADGTAVNLGWDKRYKIKDVVKMILEIVGYNPRISYDKSKPEGPFSRALDVSLANQLLGWTPRIDLREGLDLTMRWMKEQ
jgi:nucleoside-diphosphate-sugar epimerase/intein/homing endonuclease